MKGRVKVCEDVVLNFSDSKVARSLQAENEKLKTLSFKKDAEVSSLKKDLLLSSKNELICSLEKDLLLSSKNALIFSLQKDKQIFEKDAEICSLEKNHEQNVLTLQKDLESSQKTLEHQQTLFNKDLECHKLLSSQATEFQHKLAQINSENSRKQEESSKDALDRLSNMLSGYQQHDIIKLALQSDSNSETIKCLHEKNFFEKRF